KGRNLFEDGYYAPAPADELKCPDLELNVLQSIEDVTAAVEQAVRPDMPPAAAAARSAAMARIERESLKATGLRSDVVTLYQGGQYHLYRYKKYTDVRLVFTPENDIGQFGGDVDNFEYPRHGLDVCFFRVYEDGKPLKTDHFFRWNPAGPSDGDLVFVSGHPGSTNRLETLARLKHRRDLTLPYTLARLRHMEALLTQYSATGPEAARAALTDLYSVANARKAITGQYQGLLDPAIVQRKQADEEALRAAAGQRPDLGKACLEALGRVEAAQTKLAAFEREYALLELGDGMNSRLFRIARHLKRLADELPKKDGDRLREYREAGLGSLKFQLLSPAPIGPDLERVKLAGSLAFLAEQLGGEHRVTVKVLGGKARAARAAELIAGTKLADPGERKRLAEGGRTAVDGAGDSMLAFARLVDADARRLRKQY